VRKIAAIIAACSLAGLVHAYFNDDAWFAMGVSASGPLVPDITAHYLLNDNLATTAIIDSSTYANTGTASANTSVLSITGKVNRAFQFNGTSQYATAPASASFKPGTGNLTVAFWLNPQGYGAPALNWSALVDSRAWVTGMDLGWCIGFGTRADFPDYRRLSTHYADGSQGWDIASDGTQCGATLIPLNVWMHHVVIFDRTQGKIHFYTNGVLEVTRTPTAGYPSGSITQTVSFCIGRDNRGGYIPSKFDDIRIYKRALTSNEVAIIYNAGSGTEQE
jgi:hypothetical protein